MSTTSSLRRTARALPLAPCVLASALMLAFPAAAQSNAALQKELRELQQRMAELEAKLKAAEEMAKAADANAKAADASAKATAAGASSAKPQWGMTPEQLAEFNRLQIKAEATEDSIEASGLKGLTISGYIDPTFIYNKKQGNAGFQFLNGIGDGGFNYDNSFFGMAYLEFTKETDSNTRWKLTLAPNRGVGAGIDSPSIVHEASVSIPLTDLQTRLIAGQVPDWSGYEYLPATQTKLITHNLLFDFTLPFTYTCVGLDLGLGNWTVKSMLANMNASKRAQREKAPVIAYRADYSSGEFAGFGFAGVHGKAANFTENIVDGTTGEVIPQRDSHVDLFEVDGYFTRGDLTVQGQVSFGQQKKASITPDLTDPADPKLRNSRWWGFSTLVALKMNPRLEGVARFDYLNNKKNGGGLLGYTASDDLNGIGPGWTYDEATETWSQNDPDKGTNRMALTVGMNYLFNTNTTFKAEYRLDRANQAVFVDAKTGSYGKTNHLLGASVVVSF